MSTSPYIPTWLRSKLVKHTTQLLSANIIAQAIGLGVYPLLTRLYSPADFGLFNLFLSIGGVLLLLATGAYYSAIVLPPSSQQGAACFQVGMACNVLVTALCAVSVFFAPQIAALFQVPSLAHWYYLLPVYVFLSATWQLLNYWYVRNQQFGLISTYQVEQNLLNAGAKWLFGQVGMLGGGMLYAVVIAPFLSLLTVVIRSFSSLKPLFLINWKQCQKVAYTYRKFPQFTLPKQLINYLGGNMPVLLLTPFFELTDIGYFGMALTLSFVPVSLVTRSFYQVFFSDVTRLVNKGLSVWQPYRKLIIGAVLIILLVFTGLFFVLPSVTAWLLGDSWEVVGHYIRVMLPWLAVIFITNTFDFVFDVFGKQDKQFYFELVLFILRGLVLAVGIYCRDFWWAIAGFSAVSMFVRVFYAAYQYSLIHRYEKQCNSI